MESLSVPTSLNLTVLGTTFIMVFDQISMDAIFGACVYFMIVCVGSMAVGLGFRIIYVTVLNSQKSWPLWLWVSLRTCTLPHRLRVIHFQIRL